MYFFRSQARLNSPSASSSLSVSVPKVPVLFRLRSSKFTILSIITLAVFTDSFLYSIIVPVIPFSLHDRLGVPEDDIQRYVSLLLATFAFGIMLFSPVFGYFADRYPSRQGPFLLGLLVLALANSALCFGDTLFILFVGRLFQGAAAAMVWCIGFAMVPETVGDKAGAAIGWVTMGSGIGLLSGPVVGGWVYDRWGYYAVFGVSFALLAIDVVFRSVIIERKVARKIEADLKSWEARSLNNADIEDLDGSTDVSDAADENPELDELDKKEQTRFPMGLLLSTPRFLSALWGIVVLGMMLTAFDSVLPLFVHRTFDWGPTEAGLIFLGIALPSLFDPLFGHLSDVYGPRRLAFTAFVAAVPLYAILQMVQEQSDGHKALLCIDLVMIGVCICVGMTPLTAECSEVVDAYKKTRPGIFGENGAFAQCFALANVGFATGCLLGPLWAGFMAETFGFGAMALSLAALCLITSIPTYLFCGQDIVNKEIEDGRRPMTGYGTI